MDKCLQQKCENLNLDSQNLPEKPGAAVHISVIPSLLWRARKPEQKRSNQLVWYTAANICRAGVKQGDRQGLPLSFVLCPPQAHWRAHSETHAEAYIYEREREYFVFILLFCKVANC